MVKLFEKEPIAGVTILTDNDKAFEAYQKRQEDAEKAKGTPGAAPPGGGTPPAPAVLPEDIKKFMEDNNIKSLDELKTKITPAAAAPAAPVLTEQERKIQAEQEQVAIISHFVSKGGTTSELNDINAFTKRDNIDIAKEEYATFLKSKNAQITAEQIEASFNKAFMINTDPERPVYDATEVEEGQRRLAEAATNSKNKKLAPLLKAENEYKSIRFAQAKEEEFIKQVESYQVPEKVEYTVTTGKDSEGKVIQSKVVVPIGADEKKKLVESMKGPNKLFKSILTDDGKGFDMNKLADIMMRNELFDHIISDTYTQAHSAGLEAGINQYKQPAQPLVGQQGGGPSQETIEKAERESIGKAIPIPS